MVRKYFGTDGIRGKANEGAMTAETALRVGMAAGRVFRRGDHRHRVVIGKDTRLSGYMLSKVLQKSNDIQKPFVYAPFCCKAADFDGLCITFKPTPQVLPAALSSDFSALQNRGGCALIG